MRHIWLSRWHLPKGSTNITCPSVCCAHERTYSPELRSLKESSFKNEKKASAKIKAMKWHCSHQEWDEEKEGDWGRAQWLWVQPTSHFKVKSISGDIQLVKALEGRVGNLIHLAKYHPRQWQGTRTRDGHVVTSELFNRTGAAMERTLLKTLLTLFTVMLTVTQGKNVRFFFYILFFLLFILVTWQKKDVGLF